MVPLVCGRNTHVSKCSEKKRKIKTNNISGSGWAPKESEHDSLPLVMSGWAPKESGHDSLPLVMSC